MLTPPELDELVRDMARRMVDMDAGVLDSPLVYVAGAGTMQGDDVPHYEKGAYKGTEFRTDSGPLWLSDEDFSEYMHMLGHTYQESHFRGNGSPIAVFACGIMHFQATTFSVVAALSKEGWTSGVTMQWKKPRIMVKDSDLPAVAPVLTFTASKSPPFPIAGVPMKAFFEGYRCARKNATHLHVVK